MAWKFLNIGKANAEIDRLNAELAKVTKEREEAAKVITASTTQTATAGDGDEDEDDMNCAACNGTGTCAECMGNGKCAECSGTGEADGEASARKPKGKLAQAHAALDEAHVELSRVQTESASLKSHLTAKDAEIASLNEKLSKKDSEVTVKVAQQLATQQAQLGQPPVAAIPKENPEETNVKTGMSRILAACRSDLQGLGYEQPKRN